MKIIDQIKDNYRKAKEQEDEYRKLREIERQKKDLKLNDEDIRDIIKLISEQNPAWVELDPDIMKLMFKLAMHQYKPKEEDFDISDRAQLKQKIADIFNTSDKITFVMSGREVSAGKVTPMEIKQLNDAYMRGKNIGGGFKKALTAVFKKKLKSI